MKNLKRQSPRGKSSAANALVVTMVLTATALLTLAGVLGWSNGGSRIDARSGQYNRSLSAAEAATEKAAGQIMQDFLSGSESLVVANMTNYQSSVPSTSDSAYWASYQFSDAQGNTGKNHVQRMSTTNYTVLGAPYSGLFGYVSTYDIVSDAAELPNVQSVIAGSLQELQLTTIPIFQFAMYSSGDLEIEPGANLFIAGAVHANGNLFCDPNASTVEFGQGVSLAGWFYWSRSWQDCRGNVYSGNVIFDQGYTPGSAYLTLPIGTTNSPAAVRAIIEPPPNGESPTSAIGLLRYYNKADMLIRVTGLGVTATSGRFNSFMTVISSADVAKFATATANFYDMREGKYVYPVDINVSNLVKWSATNSTLRTALGNRDVASIYVYDTRVAVGSTLYAARVLNAQQLPSLGLTVATADPLYVKGHFNQTNSAYLGTTNTTTTKPASLVSDALTLLSSVWNDANGAQPLSGRVAVNTTMNAAILSGQVYTTNCQYSGGMENFVRLLEDWSTSTFAYNGSMIVMFPSQYATNVWPNTQVVYNAPNRQFTFDPNFSNPAKLPPLTPSLETVTRSKWSSLAANTTTASTNLF